MNIDKIKQLLIPEEGFSSKPYLDTKGKVTIGYGRNLSILGFDMKSALEKWPTGISKSEAIAFLEQDIMNAIDQLRAYVPIFKLLDEVRQCVLIDMAFNMGVKGLLGFHDALYFIARGDYKHAAIEMLDSKWAKIDVGARAIKLAKMMRTGEWPQ